MIWNNRFFDKPIIFNGRYVYVSVDGTDCQIMEPQPFSPMWYSHKFHGPGVRYEIGLSVETGRLVWANGPYMCGKYPDNSIFCQQMKQKLLDGEFVIGDAGYTDRKCIRQSPNHSDINSIWHSRLRARHETVNARLKSYQVLHQIFRHDKSLHSDCFHAVVQITALCLMTSNPLFK